jgi:hypothetical protein
MQSMSDQRFSRRKYLYRYKPEGLNYRMEDDE